MSNLINYRTSNVVVKLSQSSSGVLSATSSAVGLRNQITELRSIEDIADVAEINVTNGATLVYNAETDKYEVKPITYETIGAMDGGSF
jgi:bisphosphoglycerate-dependent phosphoglycerate mutase